MGKIDNLIGLAKRAGSMQSGEFSVEKSVKTGKAHLVLLAEDASHNTEKKFRNMCTYYKVPIYVYGTKESLGRCMGQDIRSTAAVEDSGFAKAMIKKIEANEKI